METSTDPGRADARSGDLAELRRQFAAFGEVQAKQSQSLDIITGKFNGLEEASADYAFKLVVLDSGVRQLKAEVSGKFARLDNDVDGLKGHFGWLRGQFTADDGLLVGLSQDVYSLKDDVAELKTDVAELKTDVAWLRSGLAEFKEEVRGTLGEILDRLPAKAA
jgi:chromosome segregation ATPase